MASVRNSQLAAAKLCLRVNQANPNHHLWNNHGTWFIHYTIAPTPVTAKRVRASLGTGDLQEARRKRDELFARLSHPSNPARSREVRS